MKKACFFCMTFLLSLVALLGCSSDDDIIGNRGIPPTFDIENYTFTSEGGKIITRQTNDKMWIIIQVWMKPGDTAAFEYLMNNGYRNFLGYNEIIGSWFEIKRIGDKEIEIKVERNETGEERLIYIYTPPRDNLNTWKCLIFKQEK